MEKLYPDVKLYILFESIRNNWSDRIVERGNAIIKILPSTTFIEKKQMKELMNNMIEFWNIDRENFDGRHFARDGKFCYYTLFEHFKTLDNLKDSCLLKWGNSNDGSIRCETDMINFIRYDKHLLVECYGMDY